MAIGTIIAEVIMALASNLPQIISIFEAFMAAIKGVAAKVQHAG